MTKRNWKMVFFWVLGAICILLGTMIAGNVEKTLGVSESDFFTALLISFLLILVGGLLWISVASATRTLIEQ